MIKTARLASGSNLLTQAVDLIKTQVNDIIDHFFSFSPSVAQWRQAFSLLFFAGLLGWFVYDQIAVDPVTHQLATNLFNTLLSVETLPDARLTALSDFVWLIGATVFSFPVIRPFLVLYVPYLLALEFAAIYQHDIFEKEVAITRAFINQTAFAASYHVIHVREGKIISEDEESPVLQIGGPGLVEVELDSAIVVEDADHRARVIGPTGKQRGRMAVLHGFERIRQSFDLRERSVKIDSIKARSRDGIEAEAKDMHYVFSVYRGEVLPTKDNPYPFHPDSLINFTYMSPPTKTPGWSKPIADNMGGPITAELVGFISKRSVGEFLASIGQPELEALEQRKTSVGEAVRALAGDALVEGVDPLLQPGSFATRPMISDLFNSEPFRKSANGKGFSLRWVGVGTWNTAARVIPENHLEAWEVSRTNLMRGSEMALNKIRDNAKYDQLLVLLDQILLQPYFDHIEDTDSSTLVNRWLVAYYERLRALMELYEKDKKEASEDEKKNVPDTLVKAFNILEQVRPFHRVGDEGDEDE